MNRLQLAGPDATTGASGTLTLVSVAETEAYLEKPGDAGAFDALVQTLIDSACWGAFGLMGGRFLKRPQTEFDFVMTPDDDEYIYLHQYPVGTISLIEVGYMTANATWTASYTPIATDWYADKRSGKIYGLWGSSAHSVRVKWSGGFSTVPADAKEAVMQWVGVKLSRLRKARWDASSMQSQNEGWTYTDELPGAAASVFAKYALPIASFT